MHAQEDCSRRARLDALIGAKVAIHAFSDAPQPDEFDPYIFEATAAGAVVLTSSPAAISRFFRPDHEIETFGSSEEMMRKLRRILDDQPYRTHVAAAGQRRSLTEHSVEARMEALSSLLRQHLQ
jgi:spore maturation protein CgeB